MHRRGVQCVADNVPAGTRIIVRHYSKARIGPTAAPPVKDRPLSQVFSHKGKEKEDGRIPIPDLLARFTKDLARAAVYNASKPSWKGRAAEETQERLRAKVVHAAHSVEKQHFMDVDSDAEIHEDYLSDQLIQPGAFVELRRCDSRFSKCANIV